MAISRHALRLMTGAAIAGQVWCLHSPPSMERARPPRGMSVALSGPRRITSPLTAPSMMRTIPPVLRCSGGSGERDASEYLSQGEEEEFVGDEGDVPHGGRSGSQPRSQQASGDDGTVRAAFGVRCRSEVAAGVVNLAVTVLMALSLMAARTLLGPAVVHPKVIDTMVKILWVVAALQMPMLLILAYRIGAFKRGAGLWAMRAAGLVALFLTLLHAPGVGDSPSSGAPQETARPVDEASSTPESGCGPVCEAAGEALVGAQGREASAPRWWESGLEALFAATGNEMALKGLKVARGEELTEEEKQRVRELASLEEEISSDAVLQARAVGEAERTEVHVPLEDTAAARDENDAAPGLREGGNEISMDQEGSESDDPAAGSEMVDGEDVGGDRGEFAALNKLPPSLFDMMPTKAQPFALLATLVMPLVTLLVQLWGIGDTMWVRQEELKDEEKVLVGSNARQAKHLSGLVATAFDESLIRRDSYIQVLSATLAAIGSAQGILRLLHDKDWPKAPTLCSSLILRARVSAHLGKGGKYTLAVLVRLEDGASVRHEACLELQDFKGAEEGSLRQRDFVNAVRKVLIEDMPWG